MTLEEFFKEHPKAAIGFSGGTDSAYLLYAAKKCGADIQPYYIKTAFQPQFEYEDAAALCDALKVKLNVIEYDILPNKNITSNSEKRCYYCKKAMFSILKEHAKNEGYNLIIDGTNASDDLSERPGAQAIAELMVRSPLRECGLTKDKIRELSRAAGLFTWDKPSYSCLATRIQNEITAEGLNRIERCEQALMALGLRDFRIREYNGGAKLQIKSIQFALAADKREEILELLCPYFETILLDMKAR